MERRVVVDADTVMLMGLQCMDVPPEEQARKSFDATWTLFKKHYGASPAVVATIWEDMCTTEIDGAKLNEKEKGAKGLRNLLMVLYFLYTYPRNCANLATRFKVCDKLASGMSLWTWVRRLAALSEKVIFWPGELGDPDGPNFVITVDCRDHKCNEKKHPHYNIDTSYASKKHGKHAGLKYEVAVANFLNRIVWFNGPFKCTRHDLTIFRLNGLKQKMLTHCPGKCACVDLIYRSKQKEEAMLAHPNSTHPLPLKKFMSMARCRMEHVNGLMAEFKCLTHEWDHTVEQHKLAFTCVATVLQYQIDYGDVCLPLARCP